MKAALTRYRIMAWLTGVLLLLLTVHVVIQVFEVTGDDLSWGEAEGLGQWIPGADTFVPIAHGYLYLIYVIATADLWFRTRIPLVKTLLVVIAGTVPAMSFVAERWVTRTVTPLLDGARGTAGPASETASARQ